MPEQTKINAAPRVIVTSAQSGQRLDNFVQALDRKCPKSQIYKWIRSGQIRVNQGRAKPMQKLIADDEIRLPPWFVLSADVPADIPQHTLNQIDQAWLYEDDSVILLNKQPGWAVHKGSGVEFGVVDMVRQAHPEIHFVELVHRLDRPTSGALLLAKKLSALKDLHEQLREHRMEKTYLCLVKGAWPKKQVQIHLPLKKLGQKMVVAQDGDEAHTTVNVLQQTEQWSLLRVKIHTGRTHQIRVHLSHFGYPIVGDDRYGDFEVNRHFATLGLKRLALHARRLRWFDPQTQQERKMDVPLTEDLLHTFQQLAIRPEDWQ